MAKNNPLFFAMLQKANDEKRRLASLSRIQRKRRRKKTAVLYVEKMDFDPTVELHPAHKPKTPLDPPKAVLPDLPPRQKNDPIPPKMVKPDERRGQNHYQALEATKPKGEGRGRRLLKPVMGLKAARKAVEAHKAVSAPMAAATSRKQAPTPLSRAEIDAIDVYLGVSRQTGHDLI